MSSRQLSNYLRSNRKRLTLSQKEVAFLLGVKSEANVCRHERFFYEPSLETALAYQVIFKRSTSELFGGLYQKVEQDVAARAKALSKIINGEKPVTARKREILTDLAAGINRLQ
jgi:DNA-binding XRE family transcriptional regulator